MGELKESEILTTLEIIHGNSALHFNEDTGYTALFCIVIHHQLTKYVMIFLEPLYELKMIVTNLFKLYASLWIPLPFGNMLWG